MNTINLNTIGEAPVKKVVAGDSGGGGDEWHYYKLTTPLKMAAAAPAETGLLTLIKCRVKSSGTTFVCGTFSNELFELIGFAADYDSIVTDPRGLDVTAYITLRDLIQAVGGYEAMFGEGAVTEITKEEFYKILPVFAIRFSDGTKNYTYEEGMTWGEWVNSEYSKGEFEFMDCGDFQGIKHIDTYGDVSEGPSLVKDSDLISNNKEYICLGAPA